MLADERTCPDCDGSGYDPTWIGYLADDEPPPCVACAGDGEATSEEAS